MSMPLESIRSTARSNSTLGLGEHALAIVGVAAGVGCLNLLNEHAHALLLHGRGGGGSGSRGLRRGNGQGRSCGLRLLGSGFGLRGDAARRDSSHEAAGSRSGAKSSNETQAQAVPPCRKSPQVLRSSHPTDEDLSAARFAAVAQDDSDGSIRARRAAGM